MKVDFLSLSVTFGYDFENYGGILNSLLKLEALMFWKMAVFDRKSVVETQNFTENDST